MVIIVECGEYKLIEKYNNYYIRFFSDEELDIECDLEITNAEVTKIRNNKYCIETILNNYKKSDSWDEEELIDIALSDAMQFYLKYNQVDIDKVLTQLSYSTDLKMEMYTSLMLDSLPESNDTIEICGKTAKSLCDELDINMCEAYIRLLKLKNKQNKILDVKCSNIDDYKEGQDIRLDFNIYGMKVSSIYFNEKTPDDEEYDINIRGVEVTVMKNHLRFDAENKEKLGKLLRNTEMTITDERGQSVNHNLYEYVTLLSSLGLVKLKKEVKELRYNLGQNIHIDLQEIMSDDLTEYTIYFQYEHTSRFMFGVDKMKYAFDR